MAPALDPAPRLGSNTNAFPRPHSRSPSVTNPIQTSDQLLAQYLGSSLQTATLRMAGALVALAVIVGVVIAII